MKRRWLIIGAVSIACLGAGAVVYKLHDPPAGKDLPADTYVATIARGDLVHQVAAAGTVSSNLDIDIRCQASGEVIELPFDIGDQVKKGEVLLKLDPSDELVALREAQLTLDEDRSRLEVAKKTVRMAELDLATSTDKAAADVQMQKVRSENLRKKADRQGDLLAQKLASPEDYETAETDAASAEDDYQTALIAQRELVRQSVDLDSKREQVKQAEQQMELDQTAVDNANLQLTYTTVAAPQDGIISDLETQKGSIISSATSIVGGTTVMTLSDLSRIFVLASVDEADVGGVELGQSCTITADAFPRRTFSGTVVRIAPQGESTRNVVTFEVKIEVTDDDKDLLRPEMSADVEIVEATKKNVVMAPMLSLFDKDDKTWVTVVKDGSKNEDREVEVGIDDGDNAEIISGLSAGDKVLAHHNDAESKWTGTHGKSAGAAKHQSKDKSSAKNKKDGSTTDDSSASSGDGKKKNSDKDKSNKKKSGKNSDDSSDDNGDDSSN